MDKRITQRIAVIGLGPRGLGALEALAQGAMDRRVQIQIDIFDTYPEPGAGPNFDPQEPQYCLLNIPMRDINLRRPNGLEIAPFDHCLSLRISEDDFPPRAEVGRYLELRFAKLKDSAPNLATRHFLEQVESLQRINDDWYIRSEAAYHGPYAEVLIVPGQPPTQPDDQLAEWKSHTAEHKATLASAYPARVLEDAAGRWSGHAVAIRGFALSSFDVIRVLTIGQGGGFSGGRYIASGKEPACIMPFSTDGKPPYPKPETGEIDARFNPIPGETDVFMKAVVEASKNTPEAAQANLTNALAFPVSRILSTFGLDTSQSAVLDWLGREWWDAGSQEESSGLEILKHGIALAKGNSPPSIGYAVGQVWRKWQDVLRQGYNPANIPPATAAAIIRFDEGLKRYSYGPPIRACEELMALVDADIVLIDWASDPDITLTETGWQLEAEGRNVEAQVMIDAVLPAPDPQKISMPLVSGLIRDGYLTALDELGARTALDGRLIGCNGQPVEGLSLLGRLALGSVIATDSLHDCFGASSSRWAEGVLVRLE